MGWFSSKKNDSGGAQAQPSSSDDLETPLITAEVVHGQEEDEESSPPDACQCAAAGSAQQRQNGNSRPSNLTVTIHVDNNGVAARAEPEASASQESCSQITYRRMMLLYMCFISLIYAVFVTLVLSGPAPDDPALEGAILTVFVALGGLLILFWTWYCKKRYAEVIIGSLASALVAFLLLAFLFSIMDDDDGPDY